jgi:hypothetical protein
VTDGVVALTLFFTQGLIEITVCEANIYAEELIKSRGIM